MAEKEPEAGNKEPALGPTVKVLVGDLFVHSIAVPLGRPVLSAQPAAANRHRPHLMDAKSGGRQNSKFTE